MPTASLEDVACAALAVTQAPTVPGGDGALAAPQPGPIPSTQPGRCWLADSPILLNGPDAVQVGPVVAKANDSGEVVAVAATDGTEAWRYTVVDPDIGQVQGLAAGDGVIYAAGPEGLTALEAVDGTRRWRYRVSSDGIMPMGFGFFWPVAQGDAVYGLAYSTEDDVTWDRRLVALDTATGDARWEANVPQDSQVPGLAPSTDGVIVVVATGDGTVVAHDALTGAVSWSVDAATLGALPATRPAIGTGVVLIGLSDWSAVALDAGTGAEAWRYPVESGAVTSVSFVGPTALVMGGTTLAALDAATGTPRWNVPVQLSAAMFPLASIPAVVDDTVVLGTTDAMDMAYVVALDLATGEERWRVDTGVYGMAFSPLVSGGRVVVPLWESGGPGSLVSLGSSKAAKAG